MQDNPKWVDNEVANEVVTKVKNSILNNTRDNDSIQEMMNLIIGVKSYRIENLSNQGIIKKLFDRECKKCTNNNNYSNFSIDFSDIVSIFWENVFKDILKAEVQGTIVNTRVVKGQDTSNEAVFKSKDGLNFISRSTQCNPINWLRWRGVMGVRNAINKIYNKNLLQICEDCGHSGTADSREVESTACTKCKSSDTKEYWPNGSSTYKSTKYRICTQCSNTWRRKFSYICSNCLSTNVRIATRFDSKEDTIYNTPSNDCRADELFVISEPEVEIESIIFGVYKSLPTNPNQPGVETRARAILDILFDPKVSRDICSQCSFNAKDMCAIKCTKFNETKHCEHNKVKDPKQTCGAQKFELDKCINYAKKISQFHGVSANLSNRRMKIVRKYFVKYIMSHRHNDLCESVYNLLKKSGKLTEYQL